MQCTQQDKCPFEIMIIIFFWNKYSGMALLDQIVIEKIFFLKLQFCFGAAAPFQTPTIGIQSSTSSLVLVTF